MGITTQIYSNNSTTWIPLVPCHRIQRHHPAIEHSTIFTLKISINQSVCLSSRNSHQRIGLFGQEGVSSGFEFTLYICPRGFVKFTTLILWINIWNLLSFFCARVVCICLEPLCWTSMWRNIRMRKGNFHFVALNSVNSMELSCFTAIYAPFKKGKFIFVHRCKSREAGIS